MTAYNAPIRDMLFAMKEVGGLSTIFALPGNEEMGDELVGAILEEAGKFAGNVLAPLNHSADRQGCRWSNGVVTTPDGIKEAYLAFRENGWNAMPAEIEHGGQGLPALVSTPVLEMWKASNMAFSLCQMLTLGAVSAIAHHGTEEQKATYLPRMVEGAWTGTMNLTEPQAGSDLAAVRTRAAPEGAHYRIIGTKIFITWGENDVAENIIHLVLARLPDAPPGVKGISLFIVPKFLVNPDGSLGARNDLVCASIEHKLGIHGSPTAVMSFGDNGGAIGYLIGEPNRGLEYMFTMMNHARLNVGLEGVAISERAYQQARDYARERVQGRPVGAPTGTPIVGHPDVRRMLLDMKARIEAMRALAYYTAGRMDIAHLHPDARVRSEAQSLVDLLTPIVKGWCTENAIQIASTGVQVHGGVGFVEETGAAQHYRDARITTIYEGTTAIQANDLVGRKIARDGGVAATALVGLMRTSIAEWATDDEMSVIAQRIEAAIGLFARASRWILDRQGDAPAATAAGAVPFLQLAGVVVGGWLIGRQAAAASRALACEPADPDYLRSKIAIARHYALHVAPQADAHLVAMTDGAAGVAEFDPAWL